EYQKNARIALTFATESSWFTGGLAQRDVERTGRFAERLAKAYPHRAVVVADTDGVALAALPPKRGGVAVVSDPGSETARLLKGDLLFGLSVVATTDEAGTQT